MSKSKHRNTYSILLALALILTACSLPENRASRQTSFEGDKAGGGAKVTQAELQDDLLRFESQFNAQIQSASQLLEDSADQKLRYRAALNRLLYNSNSLGIALGPSPESNLLDMITFIELSHRVLVNYWIPNQFGRDGQLLDQAFQESKKQLWQIAGKVLNAKQKDNLKQIIDAWSKKHSEQIDVEAVRLSAFSTEAGARAAGLDQDVGGLFASVQQSTQAVDSARLFAERALYYSERAPFLFRLQARLGVDEILDDTGRKVGQISSYLNTEGSLKVFMSELQQTLLATRGMLNEANATIKSLNIAMNQLSENPKAANSVKTTISQFTVLLKEWNHLIGPISKENGISQMAGIASQIDQQSDRFMRRLGWLGVGLIALFWAGYIFAKIICNYVLQKASSGLKHISREKKADKEAA